MCKVIIDSFDSEEQAVAFLDWFRRKMFDRSCRLVTTQGVFFPEWDGIDTSATNQAQITVNISLYEEDDESDEGF